ncbi:MAG: hypothetical protein IPJ32_21050 [Sphingobacteriaceae bacterium]|nr:hypothetical protein [Sphingobacteriaceae bacterium]
MHDRSRSKHDAEKFKLQKFKAKLKKIFFWFSVIMVIVTIIFLSLGALLYIYYNQSGIIPVNDLGKVMSDKVFPNLALNHLGVFAGLVFIIRFNRGHFLECG